MSITLRDKWPQLVGVAWADEQFRAALVNNPRQILEGLGLSLPEGITVRVIEEAPGEICLVIPSRPDRVRETTLRAETVCLESDSPDKGEPGTVCEESDDPETVCEESDDPDGGKDKPYDPPTPPGTPTVCLESHSAGHEARA